MSDVIPLEALPPAVNEDPGAAADTARPAMRGDLTRGPIFKTLLLFSVPMLIGNVLQTLNGSVNAVWVGRLLGESALAATANANMVMFLLFAAVFGFGMATTVRVGQHFGARNIDAARRTFGAGVGFCVLLACGVGIAGWFFASPLLGLLATPEASRAEALAYLRVVFVTMPFGSLSMMVSMGLRGAGDSKTPLHAMILTVCIDILLNPVLILGWGPFPHLGIAGSAASTGFANLAGCIFMLTRIYRRDLPLRLKGAELGYLAPRAGEMAYVVMKGLPMGGQMLLVSSAQLVMIGLVNREGIDTTAGYGASLQLWNYLQMPAFAISSAVSAMIAQSIGAGDHGRVGQVTKVGMLSNLMMTGVLAGLIVLADRPLLALFLGGASPALPIAEHIQLITTWSYVITGMMMVMGGTMRAYGVVVMPTVIMIISLYPVRLGFYFASHSVLGAEALWWSQPVSSIASALMTYALYRFGSWRKKRETAYPA